MLELTNITKDYVSGDTTVKALKGVSIKFRKNEFVSILGQSGCGKTTLLNIIGGLDRYTDGDLSIDDISTKKYKDKDWDTYRNNRIGFVFQSYNLIPHQTVLSNVELALTLSGVSKSERRKRAMEVLEKVGLGDQIHKKPNQMSGGQMQRVAIARALVNNPDILLADEPTGALDSATSIQIMNILKDISKDKLIIMVTHNPELADKYSSRIIRLLDGKVVDDTNPYNGKECDDDKATDKQDSKNNKSEETGKKAKKQKTSMSFATALSLSLNNLMTKKARTILTAFAGSIGIIGIALILSLSHGMRSYIHRVEQDTLSGYPLTIQKTAVDYSSFLGMGEEKKIEDKQPGRIYSNSMMSDMINKMLTSVTVNDLKSFMSYIESDESGIKDLTNDIQYSYDVDLNIYKADTSKGIFKVNPSTVFESLGMDQMTQGGSMSMMGNTDAWSEMIDNEELIKSQYDILEGRLPQEYNEVVLVVDKDDMISEYSLYALGLIDISQLQKVFAQMQMGNVPEENLNDEQVSFTYDELLNQTFKLVVNTDVYVKDGNGYKDMSSDEEFMKQLLAKSVDIKIVGILKPNGDASNASITTNVAYTNKLTQYLINTVNDSDIVKEQLANPAVDVFTGEPFAENSYEANLTKLGVANLEDPASINIYPKDFKSKEKIVDIIDEYNAKLKAEGKEEIEYTDYVGLMMSSVSTIINAISYVLIAFVAISLVVSSIMIGIITYISVLERTKEIGILRSIGASKKDVSRVFNAETVIVGFVAGMIGIIITLLLNIPINIIIKNITDISGMSKLPVSGGVALVVISIILTFIAGLIPARVASKKDPVIALRTE
ncbi:ABC transporter ATP-binding protein/permease [Bovifimicola ammoniilytica]|uniref:ABC transporter ATP-binding protein/permease n=1 Tax=Bovifimicola ammoniilytica TaxID=2981720 RepID=UPI000822A752|nr:ABC transporter ATP-binding protein/permease [Bovifimicola ammoniilytica]MCU6754622.1 ABC transporter ATP-binding protein/permease [Bovifimicola ammoniilytica]SCJ87744.1 Macrolide export ATP-binding/permease protein MacB [uncultured Eubacterium sp.]